MDPKILQKSPKIQPEKIQNPKNPTKKPSVSIQYSNRINKKTKENYRKPTKTMIYDACFIFVGLRGPGGGFGAPVVASHDCN